MAERIFRIREAHQRAVQAAEAARLNVLMRPPESRKPGAKPQKKEIAIPYATADGRLRPQGTRVVWPVACRPK